MPKATRGAYLIIDVPTDEAVIESTVARATSATSPDEAATIYLELAIALGINGDDRAIAYYQEAIKRARNSFLVADIARRKVWTQWVSATQAMSQAIKRIWPACNVADPHVVIAAATDPADVNGIVLGFVVLARIHVSMTLQHLAASHVHVPEEHTALEHFMAQFKVGCEGSLRSDAMTLETRMRYAEAWNLLEQAKCMSNAFRPFPNPQQYRHEE